MHKQEEEHRAGKIRIGLLERAQFWSYVRNMYFPELSRIHSNNWHKNRQNWDTKRLNPSGAIVTVCTCPFIYTNCHKPGRSTSVE